MPFEYSCFISYRHGEKGMERFIVDFWQALESEVKALIDDKGVFIDRERLKGGDFFNERLATSLCKSACMIMIFTPTYFSKKHPYCAREYKAMEKLEQKRLELLGSPVDKQHGLIIPVVLRREDSLPPEIKRQRQYYLFDDFLLCDRRRLSSYRHYMQEIKQIATYIFDRWKILEALPVDPCDDCLGFAFPSEDEIKDWLQRVPISKIPFPGRMEGR